MPKRILIIDDDIDFNNLLTDVYTQANYEVVATTKPYDGLQLFKSEHFDLVVTDQKMPGMAGHQLVREIMHTNSEVPIVMVSGYLENETIRELIKQGVAGVFLKPLNIFSLLKKTAELVNKKDAAKKSGRAGADAKKTAEFHHNLPFNFNSFACKATKAVEFANKLYSLRDFKTNLLLVGEEGSPIEQICEDMVGFSNNLNEELLFLKEGDFSAERIFQGIRQAEANQAGRVTIVLLESEKLGEEAAETIFAVAKREKDFANVLIATRFVFCLKEDLDNLYERGKIDGNLYIFIGTTEITIPTLKQCTEDIPLLAQKILNDEALKKDQPPKEIDWAAKSYLQKMEWPGNYVELKRTILGAMKLASGNTIMKEDLAFAYENKDARATKGSGKGLENFLYTARNEYCRAVLMLCDDDVEKACQLLNVAPNFLGNLQAEITNKTN